MLVMEGRLFPSGGGEGCTFRVYRTQLAPHELYDVYLYSHAPACTIVACECGIPMSSVSQWLDDHRDY